MHLDAWHMARALELARRGHGFAEPNPLVGCIIARGAETIGEGWHRKFGGPHAEIEALALARERAQGATMYVTLEPCCHQGKTPPCTKSIVQAGISRVVVGMRDPFPQVDGGGIAELGEAGIEVDLLMATDAEARRLNAPYLKLLEQGRPWVIAKWASTLDGRIATGTGSSRWISGEESRRVVHQIRGCVDAILVGSNTVLADDPLLTARPEGPRTAVRVVADTQAQTPLESKLVQTAREVPLLIAVGEASDHARCELLRMAGAEIVVCPGETHAERTCFLLDELGRRNLTNLLVEGGSQLLGSLFAGGHIDEVHAFIAPKLISGTSAVPILSGPGIDDMHAARELDDLQMEQLGRDVYLRGRVAK